MWHLLAALLLAFNLNIGDTPPAELRAAVIEIAEIHQVEEWNGNENQHEWYSFSYICEITRHNLIELQLAPYVEDSLRFPDSDTLMAWASLSRGFSRHAEAAALMYPANCDKAKQAEREADARQSIYWSMYSARMHYCSHANRRRSLMDLRNTLGEEAYYAGRWPLPIPEWATYTSR